jgi:hypothetical protein
MTYEERERQERARFIRLKYKIKRLAGSIGWSFPYQKTDRKYIILDKHGNKLVFTLDYYSDKLSIYGMPVIGNIATNTIGCDSKRTIEAIKGEIKRRVMPELRAEYKTAIERKEREHAHDMSTINTALMLCRKQGKKLKIKDHSFRRQYNGVMISVPGGFCEILNSNTCCLKLECSAGEVAQIIDILNQ